MKGTSGKVAAGIAGVIALAVLGAALGGVFNQQFTDGGVDVRNTACPDIASARVAVANELDSRQQSAADQLAAEREQISDAYWAENRRLEDERHACISRALTADPCKAPFEEIGRLYEEIMADFDAGKGFNEAKFNEREEAKKKYNDCVEMANKPEFYGDQEAACDTALASGQEANQVKRTAAEQTAQSRFEEVVATAQQAHDQKQAILDAIAEKCNEPGGNTNINVGGITTGGTGTVIQRNSSSCTGIFSGNDPDLRRRLNDLENQLAKARAAGQTGGLFGSDHIQSAIDDVRQQLQDSERSCETDTDCGDVRPVCCSDSQVGRAYCSDGICVNEVTDCVEPEICAGTPAQCVAPDTGLEQLEGVYISRTIPEEGACSQNLQVVNLQQATTDSVRYSINGSIPGWVHIDKPSGTLPASVNVTYDCNTVQGFGPGTYTADGSITVYNSNNELINTIPFNISITVTAVEPTVDVINYNGKYIPIDQLHKFSGPECDTDEHWHANQGSATALDGTVIPDASDCGYGKTKNTPIMTVPDSRMEITVNMNGL